MQSATFCRHRGCAVRDDSGCFPTVRVETSRGAHAVTALYVALSLAYLPWRTGWSVNWQAWYVSVPFLLADFMGFGFFLLFASSLWAKTRRTPGVPAPGA